MNDNLKQSNRNKFDTIIKALEKRNMKGYACETSEEACKLALSLIEGKKIGNGGSSTLNEIGLTAKLKEMNAEGEVEYLFANEDNPAIRLDAMSSDTFFMSTNAITMDGELVNIDGLGNRVAALSFGPKKVVVIAGANKVTADLDSAFKRVKGTAAAANAVRFGSKTPCGISGKCADCKIAGATLCCSEVITRFGFIAGRINVILVNEELGF